MSTLQTATLASAEPRVRCIPILPNKKVVLIDNRPETLVPLLQNMIKAPSGLSQESIVVIPFLDGGDEQTWLDAGLDAADASAISQDRSRQAERIKEASDVRVQALQELYGNNDIASVKVGAPIVTVDQIEDFHQYVQTVQDQLDADNTVLTDFHLQWSQKEQKAVYRLYDLLRAGWGFTDTRPGRRTILQERKERLYVYSAWGQYYNAALSVAKANALLSSPTTPPATVSYAIGSFLDRQDGPVIFSQS